MTLPRGNPEMNAREVTGPDEVTWNPEAADGRSRRRRSAR